MRKHSVLVVASLILFLVVPSLFVRVAATNGSVGLGVAATAGFADQVAETDSTSLIALVLVNSSIYEGVRASLLQYEMDLEGSGFEDVVVLNWSEPGPLLIRETLAKFYSNSSLAGVLLVGDLPAAEYEMFTDWDYERFPMDLYYMDLDGNWTDSDFDGVLDKHTGKVAPEIWVGRIKASNLGVDEVSLINKYFEKNHRYRVGLLSAPRKALLYIDDDWVNSATMDGYSLGVLYDNVTTVVDKATTNADDYKNRLRQGYEWVHLRSHGTWNRHQFALPDGGGTVVNSTEYESIDPQALFYQFFVCSAARFTEPNYLAGEAVFKTNNALLAVSSTKMGGMLMFWTFYDAIARGRTIGEAFKEWFFKWGEGKVGLSGYYVGRKWFYGLTVIGDPTLRLRWLGPDEIAELLKREEEVVGDLPLVQDLLRQIDISEANYSSLSGDYSSLRELHSSLEVNYSGLSRQLEDIKDLLYFFLLVTTILLVSNIYFVRGKSRSKALNNEVARGEDRMIEGYLKPEGKQ